MKANETIGRFRVVRMLGRGAQGTVFLASDPQLGRLVAIKTLSLAGDSATARMQRLMQEARTASGLSHPNIVPVYEVGMLGALPYVVFEYVEGCTLSQLLRADGAMLMARAVITMSQILAGIAQAHSKGLMHGDITPANILLSAAGVPRVTDFGISRDRFASPDQAPSGTLRYMAPEHFQGLAPDLRADVFALGLIFWEMLTGEPAIGGSDSVSMIYQTLNAVIPPPSAKKPDIDPRLDEIVRRALEKDREARFRDAAEMKEVLDRFRVPTGSSGTTQLNAAATHSTVDFLLRRMRHKADFPVLSQRFHEINRLTSEESGLSLQKLANLVLQDFALTHKLLQLVNSVAYGGSGRVTSVTQAILALGLEQVRVVATSLMLATPPRGKDMHPGLHEVLLGAFVAGVVGRNLGRMAGLSNVEELFICSMFSRLGEILAIYYFPEDYDEIVRIVRTQGVSELVASRDVLGIGFDELGIEVARRWNFPPNVLHAMRALPEGVLPAAPTDRERIAHCAGFARELCDAAWRTPPQEREAVLAALIERFQATIPKANAHLRPLIEHSLELARKYCGIIGVDTRGSALIEGLSAWTHPASVPAPSSAAPAAVSVGARSISSTRTQRLPTVARPAVVPAAAARRGAGGWLRRLWSRLAA
ncbi:MAG: HDOD domain-containing protein [Burkholderiales bacterium]|nr:HDOD domain-containing protein [Burkholderiales bacterium]